MCAGGCIRYKTRSFPWLGVFFRHKLTSVLTLAQVNEEFWAQGEFEESLGFVPEPIVRHLFI